MSLYKKKKIFHDISRKERKKNLLANVFFSLKWAHKKSESKYYVCGALQLFVLREYLICFLDKTCPRLPLFPRAKFIDELHIVEKKNQLDNWSKIDAACKLTSAHAQLFHVQIKDKAHKWHKMNNVSLIVNLHSEMKIFAKKIKQSGHWKRQGWATTSWYNFCCFCFYWFN